MSRSSRRGSTSRGSAWPKCASCPTSRSASSTRSTRCARAHDYLFTTGGIGPTHDDITVDSIAAALGVPVVVHPRGARDPRDNITQTRGGLTEARLRMARVPEGAELIVNRVSGAPGIRIGNIFIMAGVPHITAGMLDGADRHARGRAAGGVADHRRVRPRKRGRRPAARDRARARGDQGVSIGSYPFFRDGRVGVQLRRPLRGGGAARRRASTSLPKGLARQGMRWLPAASSRRSPPRHCRRCCGRRRNYRGRPRRRPAWPCCAASIFWTPLRIGSRPITIDVLGREGAEPGTRGEQADLDRLGEPAPWSPRPCRRRNICPRRRSASWSSRRRPARRRVGHLEVVERDPLEQIGDQLLLLGRLRFLAELGDQVGRAQVGRALEAILGDEPRQRAIDRGLAEPLLQQIHRQRCPCGSGHSPGSRPG